MAMRVDFSGVFDTALPNIYIRKVSILPSASPGKRSGKSYDEEQEENYEKDKYGKTRPRRNPLRLNDKSFSSRSLKIQVEIALKDEFRENGKTHWFDNEKVLEFLKLRVVVCKGSKNIQRLENGGFTPRALKLLKNKNKIIEKIIDLRKNPGSTLHEQKKETIDFKSTYCVTYTTNFDIENYKPKDLSVFAGVFVDIREVALTKRKYARPNQNFIQGTTVSEAIIRDSAVPDSASIFLMSNEKVWAGPVHFQEKDGVGRYMAGAFHTPFPHPPLEEKIISNFIINDYRLLSRARTAKLLLKPARKKHPKMKENKSARQMRKPFKNAYITEPEYSYNKHNELRFIFHLNFYKTIVEKSQFGRMVDTLDPKARKKVLSGSKIKNLRVFRHRVEPGLQRNDPVLVDYEDRTEMVAFSRDNNKNVLRSRRMTRPGEPDMADSEEIVTGGIKELDLAFVRDRGIRTYTVSDFGMATRTDGTYTHSVEFEIEDGTIPFVEGELNKLMEAKRLMVEYYTAATRRENYDFSTGHFKQKFINEVVNAYPIPEQGQILNNSKNRRSQFIQKGIARAPWITSISTYVDIMNNLTNIEPAEALRLGNLLHNLTDPNVGTLDGLERTLNLFERLENKITKVLGKKHRMINEYDFNTRTTAYKSKSVSKTSVRLKKHFKKIHRSDVQSFVGYDYLGVPERRNLGLQAISVARFQRRMSQEHLKYFNVNPTFEDNARISEEEGESGANAIRDFTQFINLEDSYYSYLTPAKIHFGQDNVLRLLRRGPRLWRASPYNAMLTSILACTNVPDQLGGEGAATSMSPRTSNMTKLKPPVSFGSAHQSSVSKVDKETLTTNVASSVVMSSLGTMIMSPTAFAKLELATDLSEGLEEELVSGIDPKEVMGTDTKFATDALETEDPAAITMELIDEEDLSHISSVFARNSISFGSDQPIIKKQRSIKSLRASNPKNIVDKFLSKSLDKQENSVAKKNAFFRRVPNQIKSIFLSENSKTNRNWFDILEAKGEDLLKSPLLAGLYYFNYAHMNQIQILVGFGRDKNGGTVLTDPIYARLTKKQLDRVIKSSRPALCRMRSWQQFNGIIKKSEKLKLPEFNQHFLLRAPPKNLGAPEPLGVGDEIEEPTAPDVEEESTEEGIFITRLVEYEDLNSTGAQVLRRLLRRTRGLSGLMPEFTTTAIVRQPNIYSRVGTKFGMYPAKKIDKETPSGVVAAMADQRAAGPVRRTSAPTTRGPMTTRGPRRGGY